MENVVETGQSFPGVTSRSFLAIAITLSLTTVALYLTPDELEHWRLKDPIQRLRAHLRRIKFDPKVKGDPLKEAARVARRAG